MKLPRRRFLYLTAGAAALPTYSRIARAQNYPSRFVRIVVPFPPGGSADPVARILAARLSEIWGQQVVAENKAGAGGNIAAVSMTQSAADDTPFSAAEIFLQRTAISIHRRLIQSSI
jgi:tripartite-type tricarboxylate transporter receptor subunit TctC